ncbi:MAG: hypothetical protein QNK40_14550, partial [Desulfobacterales bacterium]|nr:hypothetical protein [Desulfobacterales bacterium]
MLNCSKQTVLRLVDDIRRSYGVDIEEMKEGIRKSLCPFNEMAFPYPILSLNSKGTFTYNT